MTIRRTLGILAATSLIGLAGCDEPRPLPSNYIEGEVIKEFGNLTRGLEKNPKYNGIVSYSNETVKLGEKTYGVIVKTNNGNYTIQFDDQSGSPGPKTNVNLEATIETGTRIRFPTENLPVGRIGNKVGFSKDRIGYMDPDDIEILNR